MGAVCPLYPRDGKTPRFKSYISSGHILSRIIAQRKKSGARPRVISLGYIHEPKEGSSQSQYTPKWAAEELLKPFYDAGGRHFLVEFLPYDPPGKISQVAKELELLKKNNYIIDPQTMPILDKYLYKSSRDSYISFLKKAEQLGIAVYGVNLTLEEWDKENQGGDWKTDKTKIKRVQSLITERTLAREKELTQQKKGVVLIGTLNGLIRNDIVPLKEDLHRNHGQALAKKYGRGYLEVDLVLPSLVPEAEKDTGPYWFWNNYHGVQPQASETQKRCFATQDSPRKASHYVIIYPKASQR